MLGRNAIPMSFCYGHSRRPSQTFTSERNRALRGPEWGSPEGPSLFERLLEKASQMDIENAFPTGQDTVLAIYVQCCRNGGLVREPARELFQVPKVLPHSGDGKI